MSGDMEGGVVTSTNAAEFVSSLLQVLEWFSQWKEDAGENESRFLADDTWNGVQTICMTTICLIYEKVIRGGEELSIKSLETDCVENHFNHCRQKSGGSQAVTAMSASRSTIASFVVRTFGSKKGNNGGRGEVSALGVNEACRLIKDKDASQDIGTNRLIGPSMLAALESQGECVPSKADWGVVDSEETSARRKQISFDQAAAIWRELQKLPSVLNNPTAVDEILQSAGMAEVKRKHELKIDQIKRQIKKFVEEKERLRAFFNNEAHNAAAAASANSNGTEPPTTGQAGAAPTSTEPPTTGQAGAAPTSTEPPTTGQAGTAPTSTGKWTPFSARVALSDLFTARKMRDRDSFPTNDPDVNEICIRYKVTVQQAKNELSHWKKRGGQHSGIHLEGVDRNKVESDMIEALRIAPKQIAVAALSDVCSGESKAISSYNVPIDKLSRWRPEIVSKIKELTDPAHPDTRDKIVRFWADVVICLYAASVDSFAYSADDQEKMARRYQARIINLRELQGNKWCELMDAFTGSLPRSDAYPFFTFTYYFLLQQFTDMAKHGGKDGNYEIKIELNNFDVLTSNAKNVLYYLAGWIIKGVSSKNVAKELKPLYKAFELNNSISKIDAEDQGLPTEIVDRRRKRPGATMIYSGPMIYQLLKTMEVVYRRHGNEKGFDRYGGKLFQYIERAVLDSNELYQKFIGCLGLASTSCSEEVKRKMYKQVVHMYTNMRAKYMIMSEKGRETRSGNQTFTTLQEIEVARRVALAKAKLTAELNHDNFDANIPPSSGIWNTIDDDMQILANNSM